MKVSVFTISFKLLKAVILKAEVTSGRQNFLSEINTRSSEVWKIREEGK
jgi:hypothetical protein